MVDALQRAAAGPTRSARRGEGDEPGSRYIDFLVPGLIGMNLMGSSLWGIAYGIVDTRKRKLLKRLAATPMKRRDFLLSILLSRLVFLVFETTALVAIGWLAFGVAVQGSLAAVGLLSLLGGLAFAGIALLIGQPAQHRDRGRADEPGDDADVPVSARSSRRSTSPAGRSRSSRRCRSPRSTTGCGPSPSTGPG